jgi:dTDP-4-amino-4,6-dideoxygalactose transaminase
MTNQQPTSVYVTQPDLPPLEEFLPLLEQIWNTRILTNGGPFHSQLEKELCSYLGVPHISLFSNGTIALLTALQALDISGEVITTPYSFVATAHSLLWNSLTPVFVDIDPVTLNLDPSKIQAAITGKTSAILPVHVYGYPCDVDAIDLIAAEKGLKVIYDAAHAFGVKCHCGSVLNHGDLSVLSFHATKVFNTFEGGAIICKDPETKNRIDQLKNFGFVNETTVSETGINGKMNEFSAALGLLQLTRVDLSIEKRKVIDELYRSELKNIPGIGCHMNSGLSNYSYFPIFVEDSYPLTRDELYETLKRRGFNARRYFYPLITDFPMYKNLAKNRNTAFPVATGSSRKVLCLPIYPDLAVHHQQQIIEVIKSSG